MLSSELRLSVALANIASLDSTQHWVGRKELQVKWLLFFSYQDESRRSLGPQSVMETGLRSALQGARDNTQKRRPINHSLQSTCSTAVGCSHCHFRMSSWAGGYNLLQSLLPSDPPGRRGLSLPCSTHHHPRVPQVDLTRENSKTPSR